MKTAALTKRSAEFAEVKYLFHGNQQILPQDVRQVRPARNFRVAKHFRVIAWKHSPVRDLSA